MKRKPGRPKKENPITISISISVSENLLKTIDHYSEIEDVTRSKWIRRAIAKELENYNEG